ncbi:hypothetical protein H2200_004619 [Cladophialophora chaetospira]|uniref:SMODS and SLOG-associating 2TM effector domain-containing protein n=1 Tax=Cladophialophora chaetospira TaxID=386627 RepID=A0AA39CKC4_9EURO|nr:hypothetical protein H2200_004619 [Cladophialophora chaetospira]
MPSNERTPLLWHPSSSYMDLPTGGSGTNNEAQVDHHTQFLMMTGAPSSAPRPDGKPAPRTQIPPKSLYGRATRQLKSQSLTYYWTAALSNTMLLSQVVLGAALTGLGASQSSHILITVFGAMNTIIAGLVAYLKSRGQPMRARMYRDDLERVVDEIENSEVMWLGISKGVNGYDDIDTGNKDGKDGERNPNAVTVRSEVARLTRLYDKAVHNNTVNNPDMYMTGAVDGTSGGAALRSRSAVTVNTPVPIAAPVVSITPGQPAIAAPAAAPVPDVPDPDESPATAPPRPKAEETKPKPEMKEDAEAKPEAKGEGDTKGKGKVEDHSEEGEASSKASTPEDKAGKEEVASTPASASASAPTAGTSITVKQESVRDPDASPASDPNVPLKKVAGDSVDEES